MALDRWTKVLAKTHLMGQEALSYFNNMVRLVYVENTGAFLSMGSSLSNGTSFWLLTIIPLLLLGGLGYFIIKKNHELPTLHFIALTCILAGGLGNVIDRIVFDRHVTDFLNVGIGTLRTGIFNFADMYVSFGAVVLLFFSLGKKKDKPAT